MKKLRQIQEEKGRLTRAVIFGIDMTGAEDFQRQMSELEQLLLNLGVATMESVFQRRSSPDPSTMVGLGKVEELKALMAFHDAGVLVSNDTLSPQQMYRLKEMIPNCEIWDRALTIMAIFERRAHTAEAKLQVQLARCRYELPHLRGLGQQMSRTGGGIGTRGPGETEFERHRRKLERRIRDTTRELEVVRRRRREQRKRRERSGIETIALAGYTNSGKTTLLQRLSSDRTLCGEDALFATLDTSVRSLRTPAGTPLLMVDTVGFIRKLPPALIAAFRATLEEITEANRILLVLDICDEDLSETLSVIRTILMDIGAAEMPVMVALNKIDAISAPQIAQARKIIEGEGLPVCALSALTGDGLEELWELVEAKPM